MEKIKVSIIVPVYNVEQYLPKCLDSLVCQTLQEIEILVVNDGSPDNSQQIIDDYAKRYPDKIRSFVKENGGLSDARNYAVEKARGEYIGFVDSDDYVREDMFELLYKKAKEEESDVVTCNFCRFGEKSLKQSLVIKNLENFAHSVEEKPEILFESKSYAWNKIYRRAWYVENEFQFPVGQWFEDSAVVYNMLYMANRVSAVENALYFYRVDREGSITNTLNRKIFDILKSCESITTFYYAKTQTPDVLDVVDRVCQIHLFTRMKDLLSSSSYKMKWEYYAQMLAFLNKNTRSWTKNPYYQKVKKRTLYLRFRHIPWMMCVYLIYPKGLEKTKKLVGRFLRIIGLKPALKKKKRRNYYINKTRLRELQMIELDILKEIDRLCKENGLIYYLGEGTLLGAIRHQGFIPWDDDLDIVMPRADYEKFIEIASEQLQNGYFCLNEKSSDTYYLPFTKVVSLESYGFVNKLDKFGDNLSGPFVDIFPLDSCANMSKEEIERKYKKIRRIRDELLLKAKYIKPKTRKRKWYNFLAKFYSNEQLHSQLYQEVVSDNHGDTCLCNFASSYHPSRQIVPKEVYGEPLYVPFEDGVFPVPADAHTLLTTIYGDYMRMPSVRKRVCRHSFYDRLSIERKNETQPAEKEEMEKQALEEVRKLQMIELDILKEVDRVCKEHNIRYYLGEGTLLGAIRHAGFIPWDDDVDIVMPREDLNRFMKICDQSLSANYKFQYYHNVKQYWVQSPKVRLLDKTEFSQPALKKYTEDIGPYIDIFPLDYAPDSIEKLKKQDKYIKTYRRILFLKTKFSTPKNRKQKFMKFYSRFMSVETIHKKIDKRAVKYQNGPRNYICNFGSYYDIEKEVFPIETFGEPVYVPFEGMEFPVPADYHYVLEKTYGDYMTPPPKNKQVAKHSFG